ncbi:ATP-binding protein [Polyangium aurulentum]|uniref:hybrid sensor histidine kinase/response regulator n=1 Tax=Polyangium aurulentum TaxID=2567896 RepID=UPI00146AA2B5|nr:ATP-binding protein [Polyangium aurulentum]UQA57710.1 response regulator [Polyangium aurulentum]
MNVDSIRERLASLGDPSSVLTQVFAFSPIPLQVLRPDGGSLLVNEAYRQRFGAEPSPEYNLFEDRIAAQNGVVEPLRRAFRGESVQIPPVWYDLPAPKNGGGEGVQRVALEASCVPLRDAQGAVSFVLVQFHDRTEEMLAKKRSAEAEVARDRLQMLVTQLPIGVTALLEERGKLRYVTASERYLALAALPADKLFGRTPAEAFPHLAGQGYFELIDNVYRTGESVHGLGSPAAWDDDGDGEPEQHFVDFVYAPLRGKDRNEGIVVVVTEVDERVRAEKERDELLARERRAREEVEMASRAKDEFISVASHELRTPLNAILGWVQMLSSGMLSSDQARKAIGTIERNAKAQAQLIDDLLDISRIIAGKLRLEVGPVDLARVVEAALDVVTPAANGKGVQLEVFLERPALMAGDPDRLQQVIWNLLSNAVKFTPRGGRVTVRMESSGPHRVVSVEDTGPGIETQFLPHVFERFRQADMATTRKHGGLGLGLAIVRQLVEMHGGAVEVASEGLGKGATFRVRLPVIPPLARGPTVTLPHATPDMETASNGGFERPAGIEGLHVLVVDDEVDARDMLAEILGQCKARVVTAGSAEEALERLRQDPPDVLVSDVGMPDEDGYTLISKVRRLPKDQGGRTPAVALTAYARAEDRTKALRAGFDMHLPKPVQPTEFLLVVARAAGRAPDIGGR